MRMARRQLLAVIGHKGAASWLLWWGRLSVASTDHVAINQAGRGCQPRDLKSQLHSLPALYKAICLPSLSPSGLNQLSSTTVTVHQLLKSENSVQSCLLKHLDLKFGFSLETTSSITCTILSRVLSHLQVNSKALHQDVSACLFFLFHLVIRPSTYLAASYICLSYLYR